MTDPRTALPDSSQNAEAVEAVIDSLCPLDDDMMQEMFADNTELAQLVLRIILRKDDLVITSADTQRNLVSLTSARGACLDVYATDAEGRIYDIEIQRSNSGADVYRARYYSSLMDVDFLRQGKDFSTLPDSYTIFVTENDVRGKGKPFYFYLRKDAEDGSILGEKSFIVYVNASYSDEGQDGTESEFSRLMHDFRTSDPDKMRIPLMRDTVSLIKKNSDRRKKMGSTIEKALEKYRDTWTEEGIEIGEHRHAVDSAKTMLERGFPCADIADILKLPLAEVEQLEQARRNA